MFTLPNQTTLPLTTAAALQSLVTQLNAWASAEHNNDGSHAAITAESIQLDPNVTTQPVPAPTNQVGQLINLPYGQTRFVTIGTPSTDWTVTNNDMYQLAAIQVGQLVCVQFALFNTVLSSGLFSNLGINVPEFQAQLITTPNGLTACPPTGGGFWIDFQHNTNGLLVTQVDGAQAGSSAPQTTIGMNCFGAGAIQNWPASTQLTIQGSVWFISTPANKLTGS